MPFNNYKTTPRPRKANPTTTTGYWKGLIFPEDKAVEMWPVPTADGYPTHADKLDEFRDKYTGAYSPFWVQDGNVELYVAGNKEEETRLIKQYHPELHISPSWVF